MLQRHTVYQVRFTIKITNDNVEDEKGNHPEVSKEKKIFIAGALYPNDYHTQFEIAKDNEYLMKEIDECRSRSRELQRGDRVACEVFMIEEEIHNGVSIYKINGKRRDMETYTKSELWLYPNPKSSYRIGVDTPETLKFRKQQFYMLKNSEKYEKIVSEKWYTYINKWWTNKNPKMIFPILWGIRVKTTVSNLWGRLTRQENLPKTSLNCQYNTCFYHCNQCCYRYMVVIP